MEEAARSFAIERELRRGEWQAIFKVLKRLEGQEVLVAVDPPKNQAMEMSPSETFGPLGHEARLSPD